MKALLTLAALLVAAAVFAGPAAAAGTTRYVNPTLGLPPLGMSCETAAFTSIQAAVNASADGDTVVVCPGTYREQVTIDRILTLTGSGNSIIEAPATLVPDSEGKRNIVDVRAGASAVMRGFTISGPGPGGCASIDTGIAVFEGASLDLSFSSVRSIRDVEPSTGSFSGCQNGEAIRVGKPRGTSPTTLNPGHATIDNVAVSDYQKNGITVAGQSSTAKITNTTVTGGGPTTVIAQNGIQVSDGAAATISTSTIRDHFYTPKTFVSCGLLIIDAAGVNDDTNVY